MSRASDQQGEVFMTAERFAIIRHSTGCNRDQFAKCFPFTRARIAAYEEGRKAVSAEDAEYMRKVEKLFGRRAS
ncbi:hypothetical protein BPY_00300 [Bifidobacterium psychraerophilum]|uniref:hypothetical protein n=1 Tax=Bifidobacterium psychraerophilum TaxID=218140 RepID=UPI003112C01A